MCQQTLPQRLREGGFAAGPLFHPDFQNVSRLSLRQKEIGETAMPGRWIRLDDALLLWPHPCNFRAVVLSRLHCCDQLAAVSFQHTRKGHARADNASCGVAAIACHLFHVKCNVPILRVVRIRLASYLQQHSGAADALAGAAQRAQVWAIGYFNLNVGEVGLQPPLHNRHQLLQFRCPEGHPIHLFHLRPPLTRFSRRLPRCQTPLYRPAALPVPKRPPARNTQAEARGRVGLSPAACN